ncbi:hypothetical protein Hanom_Chr11g00979351 [Helianthus anomalus]
MFAVYARSTRLLLDYCDVSLLLLILSFQLRRTWSSPDLQCGAEGERVQEHAEDEAGVHDRAGRYRFTFF